MRSGIAPTTGRLATRWAAMVKARPALQVFPAPALPAWFRRWRGNRTSARLWGRAIESPNGLHLLDPQESK